MRSTLRQQVDDLQKILDEVEETLEDAYRVEATREELAEAISEALGLISPDDEEYEDDGEDEDSQDDPDEPLTLDPDRACQSKAIQSLNAKLDQIIELLTVATVDHFEFDVQVEGQQLTVGATKMQLTDSQRAQLSIRPVDRKGKPAPLDGVPVWASSDETVCTVTLGVIQPDGTVVADASGLHAVLEGVTPNTLDANGVPVPARVTVTGDAKIGDGTAPISGTLDVVVTGGQAINLTIDAGTPVEIP